MKRWLITIGFLALAGGACDAPQSAASAGNDGEAASSAAVQDRAAEEVVYVDVRSPEEYASGHVEGAINIPHTEMQARHEELEPFADQQIVLYCRSGRRSGMALDVLEGEGFDNVVNAGGLGDLQARGVPVTQ